MSILRVRYYSLRLSCGVLLIAVLMLSASGCGLGFFGDPNAAPFREGNISLVAATLALYQTEWDVLPSDARSDGEALAKLEYVYKDPSMPVGLFEEMGLEQDKVTGATVSTKFAFANKPELLFSTTLPEKFIVVESVPDNAGIVWAVSSRGRLHQLGVKSAATFQAQQLFSMDPKNVQSAGIEVITEKNLHLSIDETGADSNE